MLLLLVNKVAQEQVVVMVRYNVFFYHFYNIIGIFFFAYKIGNSASLSDDLRNVNITDEEKEKLKRCEFVASESSRPFLDMVLSALDCVENDYMALLALCLIYALANNKGKFTTIRICVDC